MMLLTRIGSWFARRKIGECYYEYASPRVIGNFGCFAPMETWDSETKSSVRVRYKKYVWTGFRFEFSRIIERKPKENKP